MGTPVYPMLLVAAVTVMVGITHLNEGEDAESEGKWLNFPSTDCVTHV